jgi:hypothetical protein
VTRTERKIAPVERKAINQNKAALPEIEVNRIDRLETNTGSYPNLITTSEEFSLLLTQNHQFPAVFKKTTPLYHYE